MPTLPFTSPFRPAAILAAFSRASDEAPLPRRRQSGVIDGGLRRSTRQAVTQAAGRGLADAAATIRSFWGAAVVVTGRERTAAHTANPAADARQPTPMLASHFDLVCPVEVERRAAGRDRAA